MGHTFSLNLFHIIFTTKDRRCLLEDCYRENCIPTFAAQPKSLNCSILEINSCRTTSTAWSKSPPPFPSRH